MNAKPLFVSLPAPARALLARDHGFRRAFLDGMRATPKRVPCKYFYDAEGSALFDQICELPEYYQTRTELALLERHADEIAAIMGERVELIEFGAGALTKVRVLLSALKSPLAYVPIDISGDYLAKVCAALDAEYPALALHPVVADFTRPFALPSALLDSSRRAGFFPGSTIGNFAREEAVSFLKTVSGLLRGGGLLIGADLVKDPVLLHAAYNDADGVTAQFNKNLLVRANSELDADFDLDAFAHYATFNPREHRIEMYLISLARQRVRVGDSVIQFEDGEAIHTEDSHKYTVDSFRALGDEAGLVPKEVWCDDAGLFSIHWLEAD